MRCLALIVLCALSLSASARPFGGTTSGGGGETLLTYLEGAGSSTYVLSGQTLDNYSATPLDTISFGSGSWGTSTAAWASDNVTVYTPNAQTSLIPSLINIQVVSGCGWPSVTSSDYAACGYLQTMYNAEPNAWDDLASGAQAAGAIVVLDLLPANPAGSGVCPFPNVLTTDSTVQNTLYAGIDAIATTMKTALTEPFVLAPTGELNLSGNLTTGNWGWMALNACSSGSPTSAQAAEVLQLIEQRLITDGVDNFVYMFETNGGVGNYGFGFPCESDPSIGSSCATTVSNTTFDTIGLDTNYYDSAAASWINSTDLSWGIGSYVLCASLCTTQNYLNMYTYAYSAGCPATGASVGLECMLQQYGVHMGYYIMWGQSGDYWSLNTQEGATTVMSAPFNSAANLPGFSKAGGLAGG